MTHRVEYVVAIIHFILNDSSRLINDAQRAITQRNPLGSALYDMSQAGKEAICDVKPHRQRN